MPVPKPRKGEKQDDYMKRCMHEVSKNKDRSNEQNVAICMSTWRAGPEKAKEELTENQIVRMTEVPFKNLASAREEYIKLSQELDVAKEELSKFGALENGLHVLETENSDLKTQLETLQKSFTDQSAQLVSRDETLAIKDQVITAKETEIKSLKADIDVLTVKCSDLEKNRKSVKIQARELVAASAGAPAPVDNSEMEMTETDIARAMQALPSGDTKNMNALYRQLKKLRENHK